VTIVGRKEAKQTVGVRPAVEANTHQDSNTHIHTRKQMTTNEPKITPMSIVAIRMVRRITNAIIIVVLIRTIRDDQDNGPDLHCRLS